MKTTITSIGSQMTNKYERWKQCRVFVTDNNSQIVDEFFNDYIAKLNVKSKAWGAVTRLYNQLAAQHISTVLKEEKGIEVSPKDIRYSVHAGCSMCPCSPGYIIKDENNTMFGQNIWIEIRLTEDELHLLEKKVLNSTPLAIAEAKIDEDGL